MKVTERMMTGWVILLSFGVPLLMTLLGVPGWSEGAQTAVTLAFGVAIAVTWFASRRVYRKR